MKVCDELFRPLEKIDVEGIGKEMGVDLHAKKLTLLEHLKILITAVIYQCAGLREIAASSALHTQLLSISASQLSKLNNQRDYTAFVLAFYELVCSRSFFRQYWAMRRFLKKKILGIDATTLSLKRKLRLAKGCKPLAGKEAHGIKIHMAALLSTLVQPLSAIVTPSNIHDNLAFEALLKDVSIFERLTDLILVFDKGYTDYDRWVTLTRKGIMFVAQLKKNARYEILATRYCGHYIEERILLAGVEFRLIHYRDEREWAFITNIPCEELSADDIRDIYRLRWMIEIFFRQLKHAAKITHLYSKTVNGVMIQLYATLIACTLVNIYMHSHNLFQKSLQQVFRILKHIFDQEIPLAEHG